MMRAALALCAARSAPRMTKELRPLAAIAMALPFSRIARSTTLPLTISALECGNRDVMLGGRPTWTALSKSFAYAMEGLLQGGVDSPPRFLVRIRPGSKHDRTHGARMRSDPRTTLRLSCGGCGRCEYIPRLAASRLGGGASRGRRRRGERRPTLRWGAPRDRVDI